MEKEKLIYKKVNSQELEDVISAIPSWIIRWGITLMLCILLLFIGFSSIIKYPEIVKVPLKINSINSPKSIMAKHDGKLISILVKDNQWVKKGDALGFLETSANPEHIKLMVEQVEKLRAYFSGKIKNFPYSFPNDLNLGELQDVYQELYQQYQEYQATDENGFYQQKKVLLIRDLAISQAKENYIKEQGKLQTREEKNRERTYKAYQQLYEKKVISTNEFIDEENKYLSSKFPKNSNELAVLENNSMENSKQKEILDVENTIFIQKTKFQQAINRCLSEIRAWQIKNVLSAPIDGRVVFAGVIQLNQNVFQNQEIFIINPGDEDFFGEITIPQYQIGKVRTGQQVLIKLHSFPYEKYGMVYGKLDKIADAALRDSIFSARISINKIVKVDGERPVRLKDGLTADADIITEQLTLLERFTGNIIKMFKKNG
ncbi:HlyD family secretion protein [Pedobacter sp. Leaf216]|uniref:HlyD family secretion protein n=1 Tax=Pedobacter sp. Leaf216 TaxID=1735684 RepID=UPI00138F45F7|nr:HlyD family efflux transporter periplasmic adaptor subunit [Pedobacter sp. Leaf216]